MYDVNIYTNSSVINLYLELIPTTTFRFVDVLIKFKIILMGRVIMSKFMYFFFTKAVEF